MAINYTVHTEASNFPQISQLFGLFASEIVIYITNNAYITPAFYEI